MALELWYTKSLLPNYSKTNKISGLMAGLEKRKAYYVGDERKEKIGLLKLY